MKPPKRKDRVRTFDKSPIFKDWRGVEAEVLDVFEHPAGNLKVELKRDDGEKGIVEAVDVEVIVEAPPEEPAPLPTAASMWISWARIKIQEHKDEIARLEEGIRQWGGRP
jgi:hypothetical protein